MTRWIRLLALTLALGALSTQAVGCYGSYSLSMSLYNWNGTIQNKFGRSALHFAFTVIPVYPVCLLADWLVLNNVEFITGRPVIAGAEGVTTVVKANDREVSITQGDKTVLLKREGQRHFTLWVANKQVGHGNITPEGGLIISDDVAKQTRYLGPSFVTKMRRAAAEHVEKLAAQGAIGQL